MTSAQHSEGFLETHLPPREPAREKVFQNRDSRLRRPSIQDLSPPHFPSRNPRFHTTKTAKASQPLQRAGEMTTSICEPWTEQNESLFLYGPL